MLREEIKAPGAWVGPDIQNDTSWIIHLDQSARTEIDDALSTVKRQGLTIPFERSAFPLPTLAERIDEDCELIYWGIGVHLGRPVSQNTRGHLLGHVRDEGKTLADPNARGYQTKAKLDFHSDQLPVDILGLFCCRTAKSGGASFLVSALTVHNVMREERPDLLEVLYEPFNLDWRGEQPDGEQPWYSCPMFSYHDGKVTSRITSRAFFESVSRWGEDLALTDRQREALDVLQDISERPELRLAMDFQEGDMQFVNNHAILHAREEYEDHEEPERRRHLLRMWISAPAGRRRELAPVLADRYRYVEMGGIPAKAAA